jgi:hypothetical protein
MVVSLKAHYISTELLKSRKTMDLLLMGLDGKNVAGHKSIYRVVPCLSTLPGRQVN